MCWRSVNGVILPPLLYHNGESLGNMSLPSPQVAVPQSRLAREPTLKGTSNFPNLYLLYICTRLTDKTRLPWRRGRSEHLTGTDAHIENGSRGPIGAGAGERGSNRGSTEEGRQKEILTKPRYTHKSPDTTRLLPCIL